MALVGNRYIEETDPGSVGAGYQWVHPETGVLKERDTTDTSWTTIGNVNTANYGMLPLAGGAMQGAITGVSGWAPSTSPNFATSARLNGVNLATVNDLTSLQTTLLALINSQIASGFSALSNSLSINNMIAFGYGAVLVNQPIPLPSFADRQATHAEIVVMLPVTMIESNSGVNPEGYWVVDPVSRVVSVLERNPQATTDTCYYIIICVKST